MSERKRAEEALRESEKRFRAIAEETAGPIIITRIADGTILYANEPLGRLFGLPSKDAIGREASAFYYDCADREVLIDRITRDGSVEDYEMRFKKTDGTQFSAIVFGRVTTIDGEPALVGGFYDTTESERAEEALQVAREELEGKVERQMLRRNPYRLTFRELTVLHLVGAGRSDKQIGLELGISPLTASKHLSNILAKMSVASRTEASVRAVKEGLLD